MKGKKEFWRTVFCLFMLLFCGVLAAMTVLRAQTDFLLEDVARSLETSRGRERKQQAEYDEAAAELPRVRAELELWLPQAEAAEKEADELKEKRKQLREEKKLREQRKESEAAESGLLSVNKETAAAGKTDDPGQGMPAGETGGETP